jgi:hypothetical protein
MKANIIYGIFLFIILISAIALSDKIYGAEYKPFIGKSITYYNTDNTQINKNEHIGRLSDHLKGSHVGLTIFKDNSFISCTTNRILQQSTKIRYLKGHIERKALNDTCALGNSFMSRFGRWSSSLVLSNANIYDKYNGVTTRKSALLRGVGTGLFKGKNYYGLYWFDRNNELGFKNAFGVVYNRYF